MGWFHNRSTLTKLLGVFAVMCVIMAAVGYLGLATARDIKTDLDEVSDDLLPGSRLAGMIEADVYQISADTRSAVLSNDAHESEQFIRDANDGFADLEHDVALFKSLPMNAEDRQSITDLETSYPQWRTFMQQALSFAAQHTPAADEAAADILLHKAAPVAVSIEKSLNTLQT